MLLLKGGLRGLLLGRRQVINLVQIRAQALLLTAILSIVVAVGVGVSLVRGRLLIVFLETFLGLGKLLKLITVG